MTRILILVCGLALATPAVAFAQNREQQQLISEVRVLAEQTKQLQLSINVLAEALKDFSKTTNSKFDEQQNATRKAFADAKLTVDAIADNGRILREKVDDTNVRISAIDRQVQGLQRSFTTLQAIVAPLAALIPAPSSDDAAGAGAATASQAGAGAPGVSADKMYRMANADYLSSHYANAVDGFQAFLRSCPNCLNGDEAQFLIGQSQFNLGKHQDAAASFGLVITNYKDSPRIPEAYFQRAVAYENLKDKEHAKADFQYVVTHFPDSNFKALAQEGLLRVSKAKDSITS